MRLDSLGEAADVLVQHLEVVAVVHHEVERDLLAEAHEEVDESHGERRALEQLRNLLRVVLVGAEDEPAARRGRAAGVVGVAREDVREALVAARAQGDGVRGGALLDIDGRAAVHALVRDECVATRAGHARRARVDCRVLEDNGGLRHYGRQRVNRGSEYRLEHRHAIALWQREERHVHVKCAVLARCAYEGDLVHLALVGHVHLTALDAP